MSEEEGISPQDMKALQQALSEAGIPASVAQMKLSAMGKDFEAIAKQMVEDPDAFDARIASGRGWIVQGDPIKARRATQVLLKACLVCEKNVYLFGMPNFAEWVKNATDDDWDQHDRLHVMGVLGFHDPSFKTFPLGEEARFRSEALFMEWMARPCTPVLQVGRQFSKCDWYSEGFLQLISETCDVVTA